VLTQVATEGGVGEDIDDIPAVGLCPEWMAEKAISIGTYFAASGAHVIFGVSSPVGASSVVTKLMTEGWEKLIGGALEFEPDWDAMLEKSLNHIDAKREALKLQPYDPARFGASGDSPYFAAIKAQLGGYGGDGGGAAHTHDFAHAEPITVELPKNMAGARPADPPDDPTPDETAEV